MTEHNTAMTPQPTPWDDWPPLARAAAQATSAPHPQPAPAPRPSPHNASSCTNPVFVFTAGRSGSTLLRFILDAHPDLACPPETELPSVCSQLAAVWSMFAASTWPGRQANGATAAHEPVIAGLRHMIDLMIGPYLARRGKKWYCDKSLGSARHASLLTQLYPEARFLCLYRHPMDLIASGLEACPWGLNSYGFEHYIGASPANAVAAIARYWADHTAAILAAEGQFPRQCHRVRYEDLVSDPEPATGKIFEFIGVPPVPDISARFFSHERERFGRSDFKIWNTSRIIANSVGRGWSVPPSLIPQPLLSTVNDLAGRLGYRLIDGQWGTASRPANMFALDDQGDAACTTRSSVAGLLQETRLLDQRIRMGTARLDDSFAERWKPYSAESFLVVAASPQGTAHDGRWLVDLPSRTVAVGSRASAAAAQWRAAGTTGAWERVINDGINLGVAFRRGDIRYSDTGDAGPGTAVADTRVAMMADLLGITTWPGGLDPARSPVPP